MEAATVRPVPRPIVRALRKNASCRCASQGDRLQQLRAMLPCEMRATADSHPLFGQLLVTNVFKRLNGLPHLGRRAIKEPATTHPGQLDHGK